MFYTRIAFANTEADYPKTGFIKNNGAQILAGDNINFETLCKLKESDPVKITGKRYSWYKIILPKYAYLYIAKDLVIPEKDVKTGAVAGVNVNLRAGPGGNYSVVSQISKPEKVKIISDTGEWFKIEPPENTTGWIHESDVIFKIKETAKELK